MKEEEVQTDIESQVDEDSEEGIEETDNEALVSETEISEEELDYIADTAIALLKDLLQYFELGEITIDEYEGDEGELILDITGEDMAVLIGRHGRTLESLQFLVSTITMRKIGYRYPIIVDVEGYKSRQRAKIESIAVATAKKALSSKHPVKMRPMTPYERRLVHIRLRSFDGVDTCSEGEGNNRHVVVTPL